MKKKLLSFTRKIRSGRVILNTHKLFLFGLIKILGQPCKNEPLKCQENLNLKILSVYVVSWIFLQTFQTHILHTGKQCGP